MRIISGTHKGRRLHPPANLPVRPTTDMAKEALFNVLNHLVIFEDLIVLDLFAGTGSISLEFASRGAQSVTSVDLNFRCINFIKKTSEGLGFDSVNTLQSDVFKYLLKTHAIGFDLIFSDAPYDMPNAEQIPELLLDKGWLKKNAWLVVEHPKGIDFTRHRYFYERRNYGKVYFSFFEQR